MADHIETKLLSLEKEFQGRVFVAFLEAATSQELLKKTFVKDVLDRSFQPRPAGGAEDNDTVPNILGAIRGTVTERNHQRFDERPALSNAARVVQCAVTLNRLRSTLEKYGLLGFVPHDLQDIRDDSSENEHKNFAAKALEILRSGLRDPNAQTPQLGKGAGFAWVTSTDLGGDAQDIYQALGLADTFATSGTHGMLTNRAMYLLKLKLLSKLYRPLALEGIIGRRFRQGRDRDREDFSDWGTTVHLSRFVKNENSWDGEPEAAVLPCPLDKSTLSDLIFVGFVDASIGNTEDYDKTFEGRVIRAAHDKTVAALLALIG